MSAAPVEEVVFRLDIGCGPNKRQVIPGEPDQTPWTGVDRYAFDGKVDVVFDVVALATMRALDLEIESGGDARVFKPWPWADSSVDEVHCSHFLEHLDQVERCHFFNELYRVLKPDAKATIITPHWSNNRAYGDPTHKWPALSEMFWYYLKREWRESQAPHTDKKFWPPGYDCNFEATWGHSFRNDPEFMGKNDAYKQYAMQNYKDTLVDMVCTVVAKK